MPRIEQEAAEAQLAAEAQRREQQIAAMAASAGAMNDVPNIQVATPIVPAFQPDPPTSFTPPAAGQDPFAR